MDSMALFFAVERPSCLPFLAIGGGGSTPREFVYVYLTDDQCPSEGGRRSYFYGSNEVYAYVDETFYLGQDSIALYSYNSTKAFDPETKIDSIRWVQIAGPSVNLSYPDSFKTMMYNNGSLQIGDSLVFEVMYYFPPACSSSNVVSFVVDNSAPSYNENLSTETKINLSVYPNPVNHYTLFSLDRRCYESLELQLYNLQGRCIFSQEATGSEIRLDRNYNWPAGVYFFQLFGEGQLLERGKIVLY